MTTSPADQRPRVLVIAEAANPDWVSVPLVGWSLAHALRDVADVHLVTHVRNRDGITGAGLIEGQDFTCIDNEAVARPLWKISNTLRGPGKGWTTAQVFNAISYRYFETLMWRKFGPDIRAGKFDLVHRVTPLSPTIAGSMAVKCKRAGVPFVIGPLNGGVPWPKGFDSARRKEREWLSYIRSAYKLIPGRHAALAASSAIIAGSRHTESEIPARYAKNTLYLPENAIDPARFSRAGAPPGSPLRACFIGRMVPYKGPDMLLEAAAPMLKDGRLHIDMLGDGPMLEGLKAQASRDGIQAGVTFHGWVEHQKVQDVAAECTLMTFPSIREFGGGVVLEAQALGLVPVIVDYAGPGELVVPGTGYKVPIGPRDEIIAGFRRVLEEITSDSSALPQIAQAGRDRVNRFYTWPAKAAQIAEIYDWVLGRRTDKPNPIPDQ